jgi:hypothetical protein
VEHGVDFPSGGKMEFESDIVNTSEDGERAIAARGEFGGGVRRAEMFTLKPDEVADLVRERFSGGRPLAVSDGLGGKEIRAKCL